MRAKRQAKETRSKGHGWRERPEVDKAFEASIGATSNLMFRVHQYKGCVTNWQTCKADCADCLHCPRLASRLLRHGLSPHECGRDRACSPHCSWHCNFEGVSCHAGKPRPLICDIPSDPALLDWNLPATSFLKDFKARPVAWVRLLLPIPQVARSRSRLIAFRWDRRRCQQGPLSDNSRALIAHCDRVTNRLE